MPRIHATHAIAVAVQALLVGACSAPLANEPMPDWDPLSVPAAAPVADEPLPLTVGATDVPSEPCLSEWGETHPSAEPVFGEASLASLNYRNWDRGAMLDVRFLDGDAALQQEVAELAAQWSEHADINFRFTGPAGEHVKQTDCFDPERADTGQEIRVTFTGSGYRSQIGDSALRLRADEPTMTLGRLADTPPGSCKRRRPVLHEFGHAIGFIHEHKRPDAAWDFDETAVIAAFSGPPNHWSEPTIRSNILESMRAGSTNYLTQKVDLASIMIYEFPPHLLSEASRKAYPKGIGHNCELSQGDRDGAVRLYGERVSCGDNGYRLVAHPPQLKVTQPRYQLRRKVERGESVRWSVRIDGPRELTRRIERVEYTLHPTFPTPKVTGNPRLRFGYSARGYGGFTMGVQIFYKDRTYSTTEYNVLVGTITK